MRSSTGLSRCSLDFLATHLARRPGHPGRLARAVVTAVAFLAVMAVVGLEFTTKAHAGMDVQGTSLLGRPAPHHDRSAPGNTRDASPARLPASQDPGWCFLPTERLADLLGTRPVILPVMAPRSCASDPVHLHTAGTPRTCAVAPAR